MNTVLQQESDLVHCIALKVLSSSLLPQFHLCLSAVYKPLILYVLPALMQCTLMNVFKCSMNLKLLQPRQLEFKPHCH